MTLWKQGASACSRSCPASDHCWIRRHRHRHRRRAADRDSARYRVCSPSQFMSIYGSRARDRPARAAGTPSRPNRSPRAAPARRHRQFLFREFGSGEQTMVRPPLRRADRLARARGTLRFDTTPIHTASHLSLARLAVLHYIAIAVDRSLFEPPWGCAQGNPLAATGRLHRTMGPG